MHDELRKYWDRLHNDYVKHANNAGLSRLVVSAVICADNKVLVVRRAPSDTYPGMWEYPGGGVDLDIGETIVDALIREVKEETGIDLPQFPTGEVLIHPTRTAIRIVLRFDLEEIPPVILSEEHDAFEFLESITVASAAREPKGIYESMRDENRAILHLIFSSFSSDPDSLT